MDKTKSTLPTIQVNKHFRFETHLTLVECKAQLERLKTEPNLLLGIIGTDEPSSLLIIDHVNREKFSFVFRGSAMVCHGDVSPSTNGGADVEGVGSISWSGGRLGLLLMLVVAVIGIVYASGDYPPQNQLSCLSFAFVPLLGIIFMLVSPFSSRNLAIRFLADLLTGEKDRLASKK